MPATRPTSALPAWATGGNYVAPATTWDGTPRRVAAGLAAFAAAGFTPQLPTEAQSMNEYLALVAEWIAYSQQLAIGLHAGDGSDGNATIAGTTSLTRDMYYETLTVQSGGILNTGGYRVFARTAIVVDVGGTIRVNAVGVGANGAAGSAGTGGAVASSGTIGMGFAGGDGGTAGNAGVAGTNATSAVGAAGGPGGRGDTGGGALGAAGGTTAGPTELLGGVRVIRNLTQAMAMRDLAGTILRGGAGGGGGGGGRASGSSCGGGGGGAGGGNMLLVSPTITNNGTISSLGGVGGDGGNGPVSSDGGGGGGGGGGCIVMITGYYSGSGTRVVTGGAGGIAGVSNAGAVNGTVGPTGTIVEIDAAA